MRIFGKKRVYLDYSAGAEGNPSSSHEEGRRAKKALEDARVAIARLIEVQSDDVIFTSGATESNALAILGHVRALRANAGMDAPGRNNMHVLYLPSSHASIVENIKILEDEGITIEALPIRDYRVDTDALAKMVREETVLVAMDAVCGETGVVWNTREVAETLKKAHLMKNDFSRSQELTVQNHFSSGALLHVDASQAPLTEKITRDHFGADMLTLDASKIGAMRGCGVLIAHRTIPLIPLYGGGGQERGLRPGTGAPELAQSFAAALRAAALGRESFRASALANRASLIELISKSVPNIYIQEGRTQVPNILNISLPGRDTDYILALLDEDGFAASSRSACETDSESGSRAVFALTGDSERARAALRISWGPDVRARDLDRFSTALARATAFVDSTSQR
ncbi:MAG: aminotransferase class V-fold PLP-dependent enzyme [Candidatus Paceibacterota bacterium]|jgi:cysteine desulfurase